MTAFSNADLSALDRMWRDLPRDHPWTGWAQIQSAPGEVWVFRERANWRLFTLRKTDDNFILHDDVQTYEMSVDSLQGLPEAIAKVPALN